MVPLQARQACVGTKIHSTSDISRLTEFLLNDFEDLFLIELFGQALDSSQGLATIAL